jgi:hypothetical protein
MKKADSFFKKFSLKRLKLGSIIEFLDKLGMTESKKSLAEVLKSIKVSFKIGTNEFFCRF